jgi:2-octaprenyl-6-methoxyphenol hydroxylase
MVTTHDTHPSAPPRLAIIGGGPVGLSLALLARQRLPGWSISVFDTRDAATDISGDPRTLALSLGSVQMLERLRAWPGAKAAPIRQVHVSQAPPTLATPVGEAVVHIRADELGVPLLGAVLSYGTLLAPLQKAFLDACATQQGLLGTRDAGLHARFGTAVASVGTDGDGALVTPEGGVGERFDLAVIAEGGVFSEQSRKAVTHDYGQTAWVGNVTLEGAVPGLAMERFTRDGPLALLPLPALAGADPRTSRAALVWCVASADDPVAPLTDAQRLAVLATRLPEIVGTPVAISPLKSFALGLNAESSLVDGRVVRIGNAAQTLHPVAGQGLNLGLRDAFLLVDRLAAAAHIPGSEGRHPSQSGLPPGGQRREARGGRQISRALRGLAFARAPDRWSVIGATDFLVRSFTWHAPGLAAARGLGLAALQAVPPLKRAFARQMMFGWR